jgi:hypothetical protein
MAYLVLKGMVIVTLLDAHGQEQILRVINENQSFGELGVLVGTSRNATVKAGPKVRLLRLAPEQLNRLEREKPELSSQVYKVLARTLAEQWMRGGVWVGRAPATGDRRRRSRDAAHSAARRYNAVWRRWMGWSQTGDASRQSFSSSSRWRASIARGRP